MPVNLLSRISGAASLHYIAQDFWTQDVAAFDIDLKPWVVKSDAFGGISNRAANRVITITFTPVGTWTAAQLAILFPWLNPRYGDLSTPVRTVTVVTHGAGTLTVPNHGFLTGTGVRIGTDGDNAVLPTGLASNTTYYVIANDEDDTIKLATTEANALAGTAIAMTSDGTIPEDASGFIKIIQNTPLTITTQDGIKLVVWNATIVDQPSLTLGPLQTAFKQVKIEGYTLHGQRWSDANSIYTYGPGTLNALPPNQAQIPSVSQTVDWGTAFPASALSVEAKSLTIENHGFLTGQPVTVEAEDDDGVLPTLIVAGVLYYVVVVDANTIQLADTQGHALAGTNQIAFTDIGTGTIAVLSNVQIMGIEPREQVDIDHKATWGDVMSSGNGVDCRRLKEMVSTVSFVPTNTSLLKILNALALQGGNAAPGQALPFANIDVYGPGQLPFVRVYGANLQASPGRFGTQADRVDKLSFVSNTRQFRGNLPCPVAYVGVTEPAI